MDELANLVNKSVFVLREAKANFKNPCVLWSTGKDSTAVLGLIMDAFGTVPFPVVHIDTSFKFREIYGFRDKIAKELGLDLRIISNKEALARGVSPEKGSRLECCTLLKTRALQDFIKQNKIDSVIVSIRRDEHGIRAYERYMSPRDRKFRWRILREKQSRSGDSGFEALQDTELSGWGLFESNFGKDCDHVRIHPILHWTELDIWKYIKQKNLPINPLYFSKNGKRYRSIGCKPCTSPVESKAKTIDEIIEELKKTKTEERSGRAQDKEQEYAMQQLRSLGYM